jgi:hypothetical protein
MRTPSARWIIAISLLASCFIALLGGARLVQLSPSQTPGLPREASASRLPPGHLVNPQLRPARGKPAISPKTAPSPWQAAKVNLTAQEVSAYASTHSLPYNQAAGASASVVSVELMPSRAAASLLDEPTGLPDTELVYYVVLRGTFSFAAEHGSDLAYSRGFEVFDAHTGNLLVWGGQP